MRVLVFQHIAIEHPGIFRDFLAADGVAWDAVELDAGDPIPALAGYDALLVLGGPMDVWEEGAHPWLAAEKQAIREAVADRAMPFLGVCLGHQLLGAALGGRVGPMERAEVGILGVDLTPAGRRDPFFAGFPAAFEALQWHGAEVSEAPPGAAVLASSPACGIQAMRVGRAAYGLQYHVEITGATVRDWGAVPAYARALEGALGPGALAAFERDTARRMPDFNRSARRLYDNFMALARTAAISA